MQAIPHTGPLTSLAIPTTLHGSLLARLDRLAAAREFAQIAAAIGREFSEPLVRLVAQRPAAAVAKALAMLVGAELIFPIGAPPATRYVFKHALVQEAAYETLLRSRRQQLHARIATVLTSDHPEVAQSRPEMLARHYAAAGLSDEAITHYRTAATQALASSADAEALAHLSKGLELLQSLPPSPERRMRELDFQIARAPPIIRTRGWGAPEVEAAYGRALQLCEGMGETRELFHCLGGVMIFQLVRAKLDGALELSRRLVDISGRLGGPDTPLEARLAMGVTCFFRGELTSAKIHLEESLTLYDMQRHRGRAVRRAEDRGVSARNNLAFSLWLLGYPDQALVQSRAAVEGARELKQAFSVGNALSHRAVLLQMLRQPERAVADARQLVSLAAEHGFTQLRLDGAVHEGLALFDGGEESTARLRRAIAGRHATGIEVFQPFYLAQLAWRLAQVGRLDEATEVLEEVLSRMAGTGERWWEADAHRLIGDFVHHREPNCHKEAEKRYREALDLTRRQSAKSLELRATTSLARLWRDQGKRTEAHDLLAPVYGWFTEGFDMPDLKDAKALLDELT